MVQVAMGVVLVAESGSGRLAVVVLLLFCIFPSTAMGKKERERSVFFVFSSDNEL